MIPAQLGIIGSKKVTVSASFGSHQYWRLKYTSIPSIGYAEIGELQFRTVVGVAETNPPATGNVVYGDFDTGIVGPSKAFDGTDVTQWKLSSNVLTNGWIGWNYGSAKTVTQVSVQAGYSGFYQGAPTAFNIEYSDNGSLWTLAKSFTSPATWTSSEIRLFVP